jgi:hypothetical protein
MSNLIHGSMEISHAQGYSIQYHVPPRPAGRRTCGCRRCIGRWHRNQRAGHRRGEATGLDFPAIVMRAEEVIEKLRNLLRSREMDGRGRRCRGSNLRYWRDQAAGLPDNETDWEATVDFIGLHSQSRTGSCTAIWSA